jgi:hypothetical protein
MNDYISQLTEIFRTTGKGTVDGVRIEVSRDLVEKGLEPWSLQYGWDPFLDAGLDFPAFGPSRPEAFTIVRGDTVRTVVEDLSSEGCRFDNDGDRWSAVVNFEVERDNKIVVSSEDGYFTDFVPKDTLIYFADFALVKSRLTSLMETMGATGIDDSPIWERKTRKSVEQIVDPTYLAYEASKLTDGLMATLSSEKHVVPEAVKKLVDAATRFGYLVSRIEHTTTMRQMLDTYRKQQETRDESVRDNFLTYLLDYAADQRSRDPDITDIAIARGYLETNGFPKRSEKRIQAALKERRDEIAQMVVSKTN